MVSSFVWKYFFLADLWGSHYLFEILHISLTVKSSENVVRIVCLGNTLRSRTPCFFQSKGEI